jgi:hypothetical protein
MNYRKNPLQGKRHTPRPLILALVVGVRHASNKDAPNGPTHLQCSCASTAEGEWNHFTSVSWCVGDEEAPRNTFESLTNDQDFEGVGLRLRGQLCCTLCGLWSTYEEGDEDSSVHEHQPQKSRPAVADDVRDGTRHENPDKGATLTYRAKGSSQLDVLHVILDYILSSHTSLEET